MSTQLSLHFSLEELTFSESAIRQGIDNTPSPLIVENLKILAAGLEVVRAELGGLPIHVNSGYRNERVNQLVGGAANSRHLEGLAADIICPAFGTPYQICKALEAAGIPYDQVIHEFGRWCHVAFPPASSKAKRVALTILSAASGYQTGILPA